MAATATAGDRLALGADFAKAAAQAAERISDYAQTLAKVQETARQAGERLDRLLSSLTASVAVRDHARPPRAARRREPRTRRRARSSTGTSRGGTDPPQTQTQNLI